MKHCYDSMLDGALVSPLRPAEYLASKMLTLSTLALVESALLAGIAFGAGLAIPWLVLAVLLRASLGVAVGVAVGVRYGSILRWLPPVIYVSCFPSDTSFCPGPADRRRSSGRSSSPGTDPG